MSHEPDIVASAPITKIAVGAAVILAASIVVVMVMMKPVTLEASRPAPAVIGSIETTPILDGDRGRHIQAAQRAELKQWRWVDRDAGVVEMPLDLAIDRLLDGGAP